MSIGKYMKVNISRTAGNVYEKMDKDNWMVVPRYSEIQRTSHLDASELVLFADREEQPMEEILDEEIIEVLKEAVDNKS